MTLDIGEAAERIIAIGKLALSSVSVTADGEPQYYHFQEDFPYFTCWCSGFTSTDESEGNFSTEDFDGDVYEFTLRLVIGHLTEGYAGELEADLNDWIPLVKTYLNQRQLLQSPSYTTALTDLVRARCVSGSGYRPFGPLNQQAMVQIGCEWTVQCIFNETIEQAYL